MANIREAFDYAAKNPSSDFANNLKQLAESGALDVEARKNGLDLTVFKAPIHAFNPNNPNSQFIQMTSDALLPPFFFGGSQIPHALGIMNGSGLDQPRIPEGRPRYTVRPIYKDEWNNEIQGRGKYFSTPKPPKPKVYIDRQTLDDKLDEHFYKNRGPVFNDTRRRNDKRTREQKVNEIARKYLTIPGYEIPDEYRSEVIALINTLPSRSSGKGLDHYLLSVSDHNDKIYIPKHLSTLYK